MISWQVAGLVPVARDEGPLFRSVILLLLKLLVDVQGFQSQLDRARQHKL